MEQQENIYHQVLPDDTDDPIPDPQVIPIHFNYNFMERDRIPLHNEKYSRINDEYFKQTEIIKRGFNDYSLPTPSHVVLNHVNSWETMFPRAELESKNAFGEKDNKAPVSP